MQHRPKWLRRSSLKCVIALQNSDVLSVGRVVKAGQEMYLAASPCAHYPRRSCHLSSLIFPATTELELKYKLNLRWIDGGLLLLSFKRVLKGSLDN